jgi:Tol biopolymer transport system component/tRNA A-37 threonylcarbamoyl transferase component Bud32
MLWKAVPNIAPGSKLSHFEILEKLGEGGMGVVYKARDLRLDRLVAIKVLAERAVANPEREARFVQEAKAASALNHPNIITVYEIDAVGDTTFVAMECVDGRTLDQIIPRRGLRVSEALKCAVQITEALSAAHAIGIVHRDLKPANIMMTGKGLVKVLDFGLAKLTQRVAGLSESDATVTIASPQSEEGSILGTVAYMSPEQAQSKPVDARSDIFSFGIVLYEMLTGRRPFSGDTKLSTLAAIVNQEQTSARQIVNELPPELDRIVSRCLRKDPARRFQHMADLHVALDELREESDSGRLVASAAFERRHSRGWRWASVAALVALAAIGAWLFKRSAADHPPQRVVPVTAYGGWAQYPCFSPDGNQLAFSWDGENGNNVDIYVTLIGQPKPLRLTDDPASDVFPAWSPDGKWIAFERGISNARFRYSKPAGIYLVSPLGGAQHKLTDFPAEGPMSWSPDGKWLAVAKTSPGGGSGIPGSGIFLVPADGSEPRQVTKPQAPAFDAAPAISPSGRLLAYVGCAGRETCDVYVQELNAGYAPLGNARRITRESIVIFELAWRRDEQSLIYEGAPTLTTNYLWQVGIQGRRPPERLEIAGPNAVSPSVALNDKRLVFSRRLENYDIWRYQAGDGISPFITSSLTDDSPQFSPDGQKMSFSSDRSGEVSEIWVAHADGSGAVQMTNQPGRHQGSHAWSRDGRWIAFDSLERGGAWHVYVMESGGGGRPRRVTVDSADENVPRWSPDDKWIYFTSNRTGRTEMWRAPFAGGPSEQITTGGGWAGSISPDGKTVFYLKAAWSGPLFAKEISGGPERQVLPYVNLFSFVPAEDGIYYIGQRGDDARYPLQFFQFSNNRSRLLTAIEGQVELGLALSPDRKTILFSKSSTTGADLMMIENFQ